MSIKLRQLGFFRELSDGKSTGPSIHDFVRDGGNEYEPAIVQYLQAGSTIIASAGGASDVIEQDGAIIAPREILTDGVWMWPASLAHYVSKYHVALPIEFISHGARRGWAPPALTDGQIEDAASRVD